MKHFPVTMKAVRRLRRSLTLWWAGYHLFATLEHLERLGPEGLRASQKLMDAYIRDFPNSFEPEATKE